MSAPSTFTVVNDEALCAAIATTHHTLVYVAPGISKPIVDALTQQSFSGLNLDFLDYLITLLFGAINGFTNLRLEAIRL